MDYWNIVATIKLALIISILAHLFINKKYIVYPVVFTGFILMFKIDANFWYLFYSVLMLYIIYLNQNWRKPHWHKNSQLLIYYGLVYFFILFALIFKLSYIYEMKYYTAAAGMLTVANLLMLKEKEYVLITIIAAFTVAFWYWKQPICLLILTLYLVYQCGINFRGSAVHKLYQFLAIKFFTNVNLYIQYQPQQITTKRGGK